MIISIKDVEPFNLSNIDSTQAISFFRRLTGNESFEFNGSQKPKSMVIYQLSNQYPSYSDAHGALLSITIDKFLEICETATDMSQVLKPNTVGYIHIEYGGNIVGTKIKATKEL